MRKAVELIKRICLESPAKVNLFLEVTARRKDGYHDIDSVMQEIDLADELELVSREDGKLTLACDAPGVPCDNRNLVIKAAEELRGHCGITRGADITLRKKIPAGGGMGGGSSNAATALKGLCELWDIRLPREELATLALQVGSDVPFFLYGGACRCRGRGEIIDRVRTGLKLRFVLAFPSWGVSTPRAYAELDPAEFGGYDAEAFVKTFAEGNFAGVLEHSANRFEKSVFRFCPEEGELFRRLRGLGFAGVRMSGSGSTLYGIVAEGGNANLLLEQAKALPGVAGACVAKSVLRDD